MYRTSTTFRNKFYIPAMVLVEVIKLIIYINRTFHLLWNLKNTQLIHFSTNKCTLSRAVGKIDINKWEI